MDHIELVYVQLLMETKKPGKATYYEAWCRRPMDTHAEVLVSFFEDEGMNWRAALMEQSREQQRPVRIAYHEVPHYIARLDTVQLDDWRAE